MIGPSLPPLDMSGSGDRRVVYSAKLGRLVELASTLEYEYWMLLEYWKEVTLFQEQPATIVVFLDGKWRTSVPDFWVGFKPPRDLWVEIKYSSELRDPNSRAHRQIRVQQIGLRNIGKTHRVVTEKDVWANPVLINSLRTFLREFTPVYPTLIEEARRLSPEIVAFVEARVHATVGDVLASRSASTPEEIHRLALFELVRTHVIDAALETVEFGEHSRVSLRAKGRQP